MIPLQGNEGTQQVPLARLSAAAPQDHTKRARAADGSGSLSSAVVARPGSGSLPSAVGTSQGHFPQTFDISGAVVDFDTQFAADLEAEIMHLATRLRDFVTIQAEQQQRMRDLKQQVENQQEQMRKASADAAPC